VCWPNDGGAQEGSDDSCHDHVVLRNYIID